MLNIDFTYSLFPVMVVCAIIAAIITIGCFRYYEYNIYAKKRTLNKRVHKMKHVDSLPALA